MCSHFSGSFIVMGVCGIFSKGSVENPISLSLTPIKTPICPRGRGILGAEDLLGGFIRVLPWFACYRGPLGRDVTCLTREHTHILAHRLVFNVEVLERNVPCVCGMLVKAV